VRRYEPARFPAQDGPPSRLREKGVYLITGGLGGIGLAIAEHLAKCVSARLVLVARTPLDPTSKKISRIRALEEAGAQVMVAAADVADREQMATVIKAAQQRFGAIHGVVHAAGVPAGGIIELKTPEAAAAILASKVQGTMVLDDLFADAPLDFMVLCSSLSAVLGGAGQVDYTAANAFLDAFAQARARSERRFTVSIAWDSWNETGMAVDIAAASNLSELRRQDLEAGIRNAQGIEVFRRVLDGSMPHVLVSTRDLQGRIDQWSGRENRQAGEDPAAESAPTSPAHARPTLSSPYEAPRTESERVLAGLWGKMLGIDQVGIHDNFFELGGDSVLSIQIIFKLRATFGLDLPLRNLFERPTVATLAQAIDGMQWLKEKKAPVSGATEREEIEL
jgi:NAD(P)-dependent dehydrogenase (short-subunit alcohol dehydrogenase family)/acyl carrier protein